VGKVSEFGQFVTGFVEKERFVDNAGTISILFRKPCTYHPPKPDDISPTCDGTSIRLFHKQRKDVIEKEIESEGCNFCEELLSTIRKSLLETGSWRCHCGVVHHYVNRVLDPKLSFFY